MINLDGFTRGHCTIGNKPARTKELAEAIEEVTLTKHFPFDVLRRLRCGLTNCRAQCYGRFGSAALDALNRYREEGQDVLDVTAACFHALSRLRRYLLNAPPRAAGAPPRCL